MMKRPVLATSASVILLFLGGVVGALTVRSEPGAAAAPTSRPTEAAIAVTSTTAAAATPPTTTRAPAATPPGWIVVPGEGWRISLPAPPSLRIGPSYPGAEYASLSNYTVERTSEGGMSFIVFHYGERPPPGSAASAMTAYVNLADGTMGPIASADVGGRFGQTATMSRENGPGQITAFVSGNDLFVLATRNTSVHARILSTFGS